MSEQNNEPRRFVKIALQWLLVLIATLIIIYIAIQLFFSNHKKDFSEPELSEYITYLEEKYGKDEQFYLVEEKNCSWFETGTCYKWFSSEKLNGIDFSVYAEKSSTDEKGYVFVDEYESALNKK